MKKAETYEELLKEILYIRKAGTELWANKEDVICIGKTPDTSINCFMSSELIKKVMRLLDE